MFINPIEREYLLIRLLRLTFWKRFYINKNCLTNETWKKKIGSSRARLFALNFDARLPGIVIWSDRPYLDFFYKGTLKSLKNHKTHKIHAHKIQNVFFLRSAKRRRQRRHTHTKGLGILKSTNIHANHLYWFNKWQFVVSMSIFLKSSNMHTNISHAWIFINVIFY